MRLERSKCRALAVLVAAGDGGVTLTSGMNHGLWLGMGFAVAKGWATYAGDDQFHITPAGALELSELKRLDLFVAN